MVTTKHAFVSGGAGGLGACSVGLLAARGWHVFAADLPGAALDAFGCEPGVTALSLDVTDNESVEGAADFVRAHAEGLDAVVNFAGILTIGSMAEIPVADFERILDVNVLGTFRVNRALLPLLLRRKGRIVNVSSETGWETVQPFNGPYATGKHAIEAYSDALRRELMFLGIAVVKIQPGPFKTDMVYGIETAFESAADNSTHFRELLGRVKMLAVREQNKAHDPGILAELVHHVLTVRKPRIAYSLRPDAARAVMSYLPGRVVDAILKRALPKPAGIRPAKEDP